MLNVKFYATDRFLSIIIPEISYYYYLIIIILLSYYYYLIIIPEISVSPLVVLCEKGEQ